METLLHKIFGIGSEEQNSSSTIMSNQTNKANDDEVPPLHSTDASTTKTTTGTFANQDALPRLPIPSLEETMDRFVQTVLPLVSTEEEKVDLKNVVQDFLTKSDGLGLKLGLNENDDSKEESTSSEGIGHHLQRLLQEYDRKGQMDKSLGLGSYIEEFWTDAYLAPDDAVVLNVNPYFLLEEGPDAKVAKDQILRASSLCFHSLKLAALLKNEKMTPDTFKGTTLCMDQFKALFGAARIPKAGQDVVEVDPDSRHVAVLVRNQFYYFQGLWPPVPTDGESGGETYVAVTESDIADILKSIVEDAKKTSMKDSSETALGVLTTLPRKAWAKSREILTSNSDHNRQSLEVIDSALFVLVLDDFVPSNVHDAAANMLHGTHMLEEVSNAEGDGQSKSSSRSSSNENLRGNMMTNSIRDGDTKTDIAIKEYQAGTCCNRWYDKLQIIVCSDGSAGVNFEHSAIDGHTCLRMVSDVYAETVVTFAKSITKSIYTHGDPIPTIIDAKVLRASPTQKKHVGRPKTPTLDVSPKKINFDVTELIKDRIYYAETALGDAIGADDTHVLEYKGFGKNRIVANKFSPDAMVQMAIILSYYKLYGEIVCAYESVLTKQYFHGRTEAMRSTTSKAVDLCTCWTNRFSTKEEKIQALKEATQCHSKMCKDASQGKGVDRHLYALKCIAEKNGIPNPDLFKSKYWTMLNTTVLSTSNCGNPSLRLFGFGPVIPSGFGIGYVIRDDGLQFSISSKHRQTRRYANILKETLNEIGSLMKDAGRQSLVSSSKATSPVRGNRGSAVKKSSLEIDKEYVEFADGFDDTYGETSWCCPKLPLPERLTRSNSGLVGRTALKRKNSLRGSIGSDIGQR